MAKALRFAGVRIDVISQASATSYDQLKLRYPGRLLAKHACMCPSWKGVCQAS